MRENHSTSGRQGCGCNGVNPRRCLDKATVVKPSLGTGIGTRVMKRVPSKACSRAIVLYCTDSCTSLDTTFICRMYPRSDYSDFPRNRCHFQSIAQSLAERMFQLSVPGTSLSMES